MGLNREGSTEVCDLTNYLYIGIYLEQFSFIHHIFINVGYWQDICIRKLSFYILVHFKCCVLYCIGKAFKVIFILIIFVILREEKERNVWIHFPHFPLDIPPSVFTLWL